MSDYLIILMFIIMSLVGIFIGNMINKKLKSKQLKKDNTLKELGLVMKDGRYEHQ